MITHMCMLLLYFCSIAFIAAIISGKLIAIIKMQKQNYIRAEMKTHARTHCMHAPKLQLLFCRNLIVGAKTQPQHLYHTHTHKTLVFYPLLVKINSNKTRITKRESIPLCNDLMAAWQRKHIIF